MPKPAHDLLHAINEPVTRRHLLQRGVTASVGVMAAGAVASLLAACGSSAAAGAATDASTKALLASGNAIPMATLIAQAKREGNLNTIALPSNWANYGAILKAFPSKYQGVVVHDASPDDSSGEEVTAVINYKGTSNEPDVVDVGPTFAVQGQSQGLWAPYRNAQWSKIPDNMKDPKGYWVGDYYGVIGFGVNTKVVSRTPKDWSDLLSPAFKNMVAIAGDPRTASTALLAVTAAAIANGGTLDNIQPGIDFFAELKRRGNFVPVVTTSASIANGTTPIAITFDYELLGYRDQLAGNPPLDVVIPEHGVLGGYGCQAISAYAPHPFAARLWQEYLYSDAGQLLWLAGYAHPVLFPDLVRRGLIPASLSAKLPPASAYKSVKFPTPAQGKAAAALVAAQWGPKVAGA